MLYNKPVKTLTSVNKTERKPLGTLHIYLQNVPSEKIQLAILVIRLMVHTHKQNQLNL